MDGWLESGLTKFRHDSDGKRKIKVLKPIRFLILVLMSLQLLHPDRDAVAVDWSGKRTQMVLMDLMPRGIWSPSVLKVMKRVPRHEFVPKHIRKLAYADRPLPIGEGQTISQPYVVAWMSQLLEIKKGMKVLEIGTGSGYQAAVLGELADEVYSIEILEPLAERSREDLRRLGYRNVHLRQGDGYQGWPEEAPFDAIIVTAAPDHVPQPLIDQLAIGGRMVVPVGEGNQELLLLTRSDAGVERRRLIGVRFVPMVGEADAR